MANLYHVTSTSKRNADYVVAQSEENAVTAFNESYEDCANSATLIEEEIVLGDF